MPEGKNKLSPAKSHRSGVTGDVNIGSFPAVRMRRNRSGDAVRRMVAENNLTTNDLIWPVFIVDGKQKREPVISMPGVDRLSVDLLPKAAEKASTLGIPAIALFPYTCLLYTSPSPRD